MSALSNTYNNTADDDAINLLALTKQALPLAGAVKTRNSTAQAFISAAATYQATRLNEKSKTAPELIQDYDRAANKNSPKELLAAELTLVRSNPKTERAFNAMLETGKAYIQTNPKLARQLPDYKPGIIARVVKALNL